MNKQKGQVLISKGGGTQSMDVGQFLANRLHANTIQLWKRREQQQKIKTNIIVINLETKSKHN